MKLFFMVLLWLPAFIAHAQQYAIEHVTVIPINKEGSLPDMTVLVEDGKISRIGPAGSVKIPKKAKVINGRGRYLMPGLFDMHAHFFYEQGENKNTCEQELKVMLANGLTTVRIECGDSLYLKVKEKVNDKLWTGPELYVTSPQFVGSWPWKGKVFAAICTTPGEAEEAVRRYKKEGYDEIKITFMVKRDVYDAIIATAKKENIRVTGHVGPLVKLPTALAAKQQIEHMDEFIDMLLPDTTYNHGQSVSDMNLWRPAAWATVPHLDESRIPMLAKMVKDAGVYVTPTNYFFFSCFGEGMTDEQYKKKPDYEYIPAAIKAERWSIKERYWKMRSSEETRTKYVDIRKKITRALWDAGVPLMAGSDSPEWFLVQGFALHDELETFVKSGLTPFAALQTATINTATYLGINHKKGSIETGKVSDLLLLDKNPLEDIRNTRSISGIMQGVKWYDENDIRRMFEDARSLGKE